MMASMAAASLGRWRAACTVLANLAGCAQPMQTTTGEGEEEGSVGRGALAAAATPTAVCGSRR